MITYADVKKELNYYLLCGGFFILSIGVTVLIYTYGNKLNQALFFLNRLTIQAMKMKEAEKGLVLTTGKIEEAFPPGHKEKTGNELIFIAVREIKKRIGDAEIRVTQFEEKEGVLQMPIYIRFPVYDYFQLVDHIGYLQTARIPYFSFESITVTTDKGSPVYSTIAGILMTVGKIGIDNNNG